MSITKKHDSGAAEGARRATEQAPESSVRAAITGRDMRECVARAREAYGMELRRRYVPSVLLSDGTEPEAATASSSPNGALTGTPASVVLANSDLIDKLGVAVLLSIPFRTPLIRSSDRSFCFLPEPRGAAA